MVQIVIEKMVVTKTMFRRWADEDNLLHLQDGILKILTRKGKELKKESSGIPAGFQLDSLDPAGVGVMECASDAYTPEELVKLWPKHIDPDICYFYEGDE